MEVKISAYSVTDYQFYAIGGVYQTDENGRKESRNGRRMSINITKGVIFESV